MIEPHSRISRNLSASATCCAYGWRLQTLVRCPNFSQNGSGRLRREIAAASQ
jgi:hypothetical protein